MLMTGSELLGRKLNRRTKEDEKCSFLCNFVHPNDGTSDLFNVGVLGEGNVGGNEKLENAVLGAILGRTQQVLMNRDYSEAELKDLFAQMKAKMFRLFNEHYRIETLLSDQKPKIKKGRDGFSVEKSIQFLNAYENVEKTTFQYEYLKTLNLESQSKEIEIKDGILYDVHLTKRGKIWFEVGPMEQASKEQSNFLK